MSCNKKYAIISRGHINWKREKLLVGLVAAVTGAGPAGVKSRMSRGSGRPEARSAE